MAEGAPFDRPSVRGIFRRARLVALAGTALLTAPAEAGGLFVGEFGQPVQGASRAGSHALAEDASTAATNPAGVALLERRMSMVTGITILSEVEFKQKETFPSMPTAVANADGSGAAGDGGDAGSTAVGGAFFYASPMNDKWGWGLAVASISGAELGYENASDFAGRYWATNVELLTINFMPSLSYKMTEDLSVAVTLPLTVGVLDMDVTIPGLAPGIPEGRAQITDSDDTTLGFGVSALWQASDTLRLGLVYQNKTEMDFDGDLEITLPQGVTGDAVASNVEFTYPQTLRASAAKELGSRLTLLASVAWEDWSQFGEILISTPAGAGGLPRNWEDTWFYSAGLRWQQNARWVFYTGVSYDTDPTQASDRTSDMPIDEQWRFSGGLTYKRSNAHRFGAVVTYADYGDAAIANGGNRPVTGEPWTVNGDHRTNQIVFLGVNYSF